MLKLVRSGSRDEQARLRREHELLAGLQIDGVVRTYGLESHGATHALVLEDFGGTSLDRLLPEAAWPLHQRLRIALGLVRALGQLHEAGLIHKDLCPGNAVWATETGTLKLLDLGTATRLARESPEARALNDLEGTLAYMAPEQTGRVNHGLDHRADFYSLGVTLYELFSGELPFVADDPMELIHCLLARRPVEPHLRDPRIPETLSKLVMRLLAKAPEERYQSSYGLRCDLERCLEHLAADGTLEPFLLAEHDRSERLQLPGGLYGRRREIETLTHAFESAVTQQQATLALVSGYSGVGKSKLVHELHKPVIGRRGLFVAGKFEQLQEPTPHSAFATAFRALVLQVLGDRQAEIEDWRRLLQGAVGVNGRVLAELVPELERLLGPQPPVAELEAGETRNRFNRVLRDFVHACAQPERPLVLFLDDLQWADGASLELLQLLFADERPRTLLVIGAYRDHEVGDGHPLRLTLESVARSEARIVRLALAPLEPLDVTRLVRDVVGQAPGELAELVHRKTEGNPLFIVELLKALFQDDLIRFDRALGRWRWQVKEIAARGIADNVTELVIGKLRRLPAATLGALQAASCLGGRFDLEALHVCLECTPAEAFERLLPPIREGFVVATSDLNSQGEAADTPVSVHTFAFVHDRVQQAAYETLADGDRAPLHLRIGRLLRELAKAREHDPSADRGFDRTFQIVDQLNRGRHLIADPAERLELAWLDLQAALRARRALAYGAAKTYHDYCMECLPAQAWSVDYELAFQANRELAEIDFLTGSPEASEARITEALEHVASPVEKACLYVIMVSQFTVRTRYQDALAAASRGLEMLGVDRLLDVPVAEVPAACAAALATIEAERAGRSFEELRALPEMEDPAARMASLLLLRVIPPVFLGAIDYYPLCVFTAVIMTLRHGPSPASDLLSNFGQILSGTQDAFRDGVEWGRLALAWCERIGRPDGVCHSSFILANFAMVWCCPVRETEAMNELAFRAALESGDILYADYTLCQWPYLHHFAGRPLAQVLAKVEEHLRFTRQTQEQTAIAILRGLELGLRRQLVPAGSAADRELAAQEEEHLGACLGQGLMMAVCMSQVLRADLLFLEAEPGVVLALLDRAELQKHRMMSHVMVAQLTLFRALALAGVCRRADSAARPGLRRQLGDLVERWRRLAASCPENFGHLWTLVEAECARTDGEVARATTFYEQAIDEARRNGFTQFVALAAELAAAAAEERARGHQADAYRREAQEAWRSLGALRRLDAHERRARQQQEPADASITSSSMLGATVAGVQRSAQAADLDLLSLLKSSQAISTEIKLDRLLTRLMHIVLENAGANAGAIVLERSGVLRVEVEARLETVAHGVSTIATTVGSLALEDFPRACADIVRFVARSQELVLLDDAAKEGDFAGHEDLMRRRARSVLCLPIATQGRRVALLYLENDLIAGAFTRPRVAMLGLLSSQIAASIENALLYEEIELRVAHRTSELEQRNSELHEAIANLRQAQAQLVHAEKMASLGRFTMGVAHEIKNPLNLVINFAALGVDLADCLEREVTQNGSSGDARALLADIRGNASKIQQHGLRADSIVQGMLRVASPRSGVAMAVDLPRLVDEVLHLARAGRGMGGSTCDVELVAELDPKADRLHTVPQDLMRVLLNLVDNGMAAACDRGRTTEADEKPGVRVVSHHRGAWVSIRVRDNGAGIPDAARPHIFEPFFTTKSPGEGVGLGLSQCHDIVVSSLGGRIAFESTLGEGTVFELTLPVDGPGRDERAAWSPTPACGEGSDA